LTINTEVSVGDGCGGGEFGNDIITSPLVPAFWFDIVIVHVS
jgi:hypothetical protein